MPIRPIDRADYERTLAAAPAQFDEAALAALWEQGRALAPDRVQVSVAGD